MVKTGKWGISRKIEGIKSIVLVGLCVSTAQGWRSICFYQAEHTGLSVSARLVQSQRFQTVFWNSLFSLLSTVLLSDMKECPRRALLLHSGLEVSHAQLLPFTSQWLIKERWHFRGDCEKGRASHPPAPQQTAQPGPGGFGLLLFDFSLYLIYHSCRHSKAVRRA